MRETRWRVVEADGRAYPPNSDPLRSYEVAERRLAYYTKMTRAGGDDARLPKLPLSLEWCQVEAGPWNGVRGGLDLVSPPDPPIPPAASPDERPQTDADCQDDCTAHRTCVERRGGAWAEGYAAGKVASDDAAACDERDKAVEAVSVAAIHHVEAMREMRGKVDELRADRDRMKQAFRDFRADAEAIPAASPDERLREALREIVDTAPGIDRWTIDRRLDDEQWTGKVAVEVVRASSVDVMVAALRAALAAADREKPETDT